MLTMSSTKTSTASAAFDSTTMDEHEGDIGRTCVGTHTLHSLMTVINHDGGFCRSSNFAGELFGRVSSSDAKGYHRTTLGSAGPLFWSPEWSFVTDNAGQLCQSTPWTSGMVSGLSRAKAT